MIYKKEVETEIFLESSDEYNYLVTTQTIKVFLFGILIAKITYNTDEELDAVAVEDTKSGVKIGFKK
jgi:hypothetical protein